MEILKYLFQPWPWYVAGPLIGLVVPALLILGNKKFGISSTFRQICAACVPGNISFFKYDWKKEKWNLFFAAGMVLGAFLAVSFLSAPEAIKVASDTQQQLQQEGITNFFYMMPVEIFSWQGLFSLRGFIFIVVGGFMVGFGTRYGGGCTSGHAIMGLSNLQWPSLVATICFMAGGFIMTNLFIPYLLSL